MDNDLQKEINRLGNLKPHKELSLEELTKMAKINLKLKEFKTYQLFTNEAEQTQAENRFVSYLQTHEIESLSELDSLRSLIYTEILESRIQGELNKLADEKKYPPEKLTAQLIEVQNQKSELKIKLGIDKDEVKTSELTQLEIVEKKFADYICEHENEFTTVCGCCGEMLLLRKRVKDFENMKHPWFAGRWLFNYEILKDVKDGKLSKEDAWRYLCCASQGGNYKPSETKQYCVDYIDYCLKNWAEITASLKKN